MKDGIENYKANLFVKLQIMKFLDKTWENSFMFKNF